MELLCEHHFLSIPLCVTGLQLSWIRYFIQHINIVGIHPGIYFIASFK